MLVAPLVALVAPLVAPDHSVCPQPQPSEARQPCSDCSSAVYVVLAVILPERCITYRAHLHKKDTKWVSKSMCASMIHGGKVAQHESYWNKPRGRGASMCSGSVHDRPSVLSMTGSTPTGHIHPHFGCKYVSTST